MTESNLEGLEDFFLKTRLYQMDDTTYFPLTDLNLEGLEEFFTQIISEIEEQYSEKIDNLQNQIKNHRKEIVKLKNQLKPIQ